MIFLIAGLGALVWVFAFIAWGIVHTKPHRVGGYLPELPGDLIHAKLSGACYTDHKGHWHDGDFLKYLESIPEGAYNYVERYPNDEVDLRPLNSPLRYSDYVTWSDDNGKS